MHKKDSSAIKAVVQQFVEQAHAELDARWGAWELDLSQEEVHECMGALLARQVSLATELAMAPSIWTAHIAPIILRSMADVFITLAWIAQTPLERSRFFIHHGLGSLKLSLEHRKAAIESDGGNPLEDPLIKHEENWINSQRFTFLTEVDLGGWSGISTRKMAQEAGHEDFYNYVYSPFSACMHSMWHHIARYNLVRCEHPLHRYHHEPIDPHLPSDPQYLYLASKYLRKTFDCFDESFEMAVSAPSAHSGLVENLKSLTLPSEPLKHHEQVDETD